MLTNAELDHHATYSSRLDLEQTLREFMGRAEHGAVVWDRPELLALCPDSAFAYDAADAAVSPDGSRFHWRGLEVTLAVPGRHNAVNAAGALTASALAGADPERAAATLPTFRGRAGGSSWPGRRRPASPCTTTTRTIRPRSPRRSPRPGRSPRTGWSPCSSPTCSRARGRSRGSSAARSPAPTWSSCSRSTRRASGPMTSRVWTGTWSRRCGRCRARTHGRVAAVVRRRVALPLGGAAGRRSVPRDGRRRRRLARPVLVA